MSDVPHPIPLSRQFSGRWQIPLLVAALCFLGAGLWRLRPVPEPPTFEEVYARAAGLRDAKRYVEASQYLDGLLADPRWEAGPRSRLHALMAEVIHGHELDNAVHGATNAEAILAHSDAALAGGFPGSGAFHVMRARAYEWLSRAAPAVEEYRQALAAGVDRSWPIRQRLVLLLRESGQAAPRELEAEYEAFIRAPEVDEALRYWGTEQKVILFASEQRYEEASRLLAEHADRFRGGELQKYYTYLRALVGFYLGRLEEAEPVLRSLRDEVVPGHPLYARAGWLLGKIMQGHEAPQPALSFFDDVLSKTTPGPYTTLAMLGRAEALASLQRYDESVETYREVMRLTERHPTDAEVDLQVVRQSTTGLYEALRREGRLVEAMGYLRIAARLAPAGDARLQGVYEERLADLAYAIGQEALRRVEPGGEEAGEGDARSAREALVESADHYLRVVKLRMTEEEASIEATWRAIEALDLAGDRQRRAEVLEVFVRERPGSPRVPEALLRLGQTYQAAGWPERAIAAYQRCLTEYPRTYWAVQCLVPLAECFVDSRQTERAEQTLLRIVDRPPDDAVALIRPEAQEYRDALFALGDLYIQSGRYEEAIARFEEAVRRYPEDRRADRVAFLLADAYRRSAAQIREDLKDPRKVAFKDELKAQYRERLVRAEELFGQVIERYEGRPAESLGELDRLYLKMSHFYRADAIYDRSYLAEASDVRSYAQSLQRYDEAAWRYQSDPVAMSAYVQMVNCHLRMGNVAEARKALQRAAWALRNIPAERFDESLPGGGRQFWEDYLSWLEKAPMFAAGRGEG